VFFGFSIIVDRIGNFWSTSFSQSGGGFRFSHFVRDSVIVTVVSTKHNGFAPTVHLVAENPTTTANVCGHVALCRFDRKPAVCFPRRNNRDTPRNEWTPLPSTVLG